MSESDLRVVEKRNDVIELPIGKWLGALKKNPWFFVSLVLAIVFIALLNTGSGGVGAEKAGQKVVDFVNSQGQGSATLISADREGELYNIVLSYQGQEVPVYVTLDGEFLVSSLIPIGSTSPSEVGNGGSASGRTTAQADADDDPVLGNADAPITLIEFSDYGCVFCHSFWENTLPEIKREYIDTGKVKLVYRDMPLDTACNPNLGSQLHPGACRAAEAAECVRDIAKSDGAYFEFHDYIFENFVNGRELTAELLEGWASDLGYDIGGCLASGRFADEVLGDIQDGTAAGGTGTPYFVILDENGEGTGLSGALPYDNFKQIFDQLRA